MNYRGYTQRDTSQSGARYDRRPMCARSSPPLRRSRTRSVAACHTSGSCTCRSGQKNGTKQTRIIPPRQRVNLSNLIGGRDIYGGRTNEYTRGATISLSGCNSSATIPFGLFKRSPECPLPTHCFRVGKRMQSSKIMDSHPPQPPPPITVHPPARVVK